MNEDGGARRVDVLIVGAGPTGLVLALVLARLGVEVRIVDQTLEPGTTSRALVLHARTMELYAQLGIARAVRDASVELDAVNLWLRGRRIARAVLGEMGEGLSPFPYALVFPQDAHERLLAEHLRRAGVEVERGTELVGLERRPDFVRARFASRDACDAAYVVGCDGARSTVRDALGLGFPGGTYQHVFYVADVALRGPVADHELHVALDDADFLAVFPLKGEGAARLVGAVRTGAEGHGGLRWEDVSKQLLRRLGVTVDEVHWFSTYRVHHRVADRFRRGRVFLAGDAAHIHSPVGGQGMNTGIGDAMNLAWKLAAVLQGRAREDLLDTFEPERRAFARRLVATTDRAFTYATRSGRLARWVRVWLVPRVVPRLLRSARVRRWVFRTVSQIRIAYPNSRLSEGSAGAVQAGDRLPWIRPADGGADDFAPLASMAWQVHVYGRASSELAGACARRGLPLLAFPWTRAMRDAGLARDAAYLVRPDGHVAFADRRARAGALERYLDLRGLLPVAAEVRSKTISAVSIRAGVERRPSRSQA